MVTLKKLPGLAEFSRIVSVDTPPSDGRYLESTPVSDAFGQTIRGFAGKWRGLAPIECFAIMPDHIHLLMKIEDAPDRLALGKYVYQLEKALAREYWDRADGTARAKLRADGTALARLPLGETDDEKPAPVFERVWHDWIVKKKGQLAAFTTYIHENGMRAWRRKQNRRFFTMLRKIAFQGREWYAYGNDELLSLPVLEPFRCSRTWAENGPEWRAALGRADRIGPGGAGVGTFMSPCEKACGNAIFQSGGAFVVLAPEGFGPRWHPTRVKEALCAEGRMLFLSLWEPSAARPDNATLYRRCHEMGDLIGRTVPPLQNSGRMVPPLQNCGVGRMVPTVQDPQEEREKERGT